MKQPCTESTILTIWVYFVVAILFGMATWWVVPNTFAQFTVYVFSFVGMVALDIRNMERKRRAYWKGKQLEHHQTRPSQSVTVDRD